MPKCRIHDKTPNVRPRRVYKRLIFVIIGCTVCVVYVFGFSAVYFMYQLFTSLAQKGTNLAHKAAAIYDQSHSNNLVNFKENQRACSEHHAYLPLPRSQDEEDEMIEDIKTVIKPGCKFVFFGFVADGSVRYQSLSGDKTWASLKKLPGGVLPFDFKECYEIWFLEDGSLSLITVFQCGNKTGKNLLFLTKKGGEECSQHPFKCVKIYNSLRNNDVAKSFKVARSADHNLLNLLPFDKEKQPESFELHKKLISESIVVMAVKYKFVYKHGNETQPYTSSRFLVIDPEYDCLAYDIERDKVVTRACEDKVCPICSNHKKTE